MSNKDSKTIPPDLRSAIFGINLQNGGPEEYQAVKLEYLHTTSPDGKEICLRSLGKTEDPALAKDFLEFFLSEKVPIQDIHVGAISLAANNKLRDLLWQAVKANWETIETRLSSNPIVLDRFLRVGLQKFADHETEKEIVTFFKDKDTKRFERSLVIISDSVRGNANYKERDQQVILEWLQAQGYV